MAAKKKTTTASTTASPTSVPIQKSLDDTPSRFRMSELGSLGIKNFNGVTQDELKQELNWPRSINTYREMSYHSAVNAPLTLFENIISKAVWTYKPPLNATKEELKQTKLINSMMTDMDQPWSEFIRDAMSANIFGFSLHEKVFRRRLKANGSNYDDGVIGWKRLPIRAQESISKFIYSEDGNEVIGAKQNLQNLHDPYQRYQNRLGEVILPRSKFILFRTGKHRGDPYGKSPLRDAYLAWRFLTVLEEMEATGVSKDLVGFPVLYLPAQYLAIDAPPEVQAIRQYYESAMRNLQMNQQSAMILPQIIDEVSRQPMFKLDLLSVDGKKSFDISKIKEYYKNLIFTSLFADVLTLGNTNTGSFALGTIKNSLSGAYAERLIFTLAETINNDLIKHTYQLNGWDTNRMGTLDYDGTDNLDTDTFSKLIQRAASVSLIEVDRPVLNMVRQHLGVDPLDADLPPQQDLIPDSTSKSGKAIGSPFEGTRTSEGGQNDNDGNTENA